MTDSLSQKSSTLARELITHKPRVFLQNSWYYAAHSEQLKTCKTLKKTICGEEILIGRDKDGHVFALNNICPHQGMPLHHGKFDGQEVTCCFHGWRFDTKGICKAIPALVEGQGFDIEKIKTRSYPCQESQRNIWVFIGDRTDHLPEVPQVPGIDGYAYVNVGRNVLQLPSFIDISIIGLMDPAHVPFVHTSWWFSSSKRIHDKVKTFVPFDNGYAMLRHKPSKNATVYKLVGWALETEIRFQLPGIRIEHITLGKHTLFTGFTALTPVDETSTEINHSTYWVTPWMTPFKPIIRYFCHTFLSQDVHFAKLQQEGLKTNSKNLIMNIPDSGVPVKWYHQLKEEWTRAAEEGRPFKNPLKPTTLRWRS